jgi:hypothetical protein
MNKFVWMGLASLAYSVRVTGIPRKLKFLKPTFSKYARVFGVTIVAQRGVPIKKVKHAANVIAEWIDNNEDGRADNRKAACYLARKKAILVMPRGPDDMESDAFGEAMDRVE